MGSGFWVLGFGDVQLPFFGGQARIMPSQPSQMGNVLLVLPSCKSALRGSTMRR